MPHTTAPTFESWDGTASGGILTTITPERTVVRLEGEMDMSMSDEFGLLLMSLPTATAELVLDVSGLTFCDCTLAHFVANMAEQLPVSVASPNRWMVEFLRLVDLAGRVRILLDSTGVPVTESDSTGFRRTDS